MAQICRGLIWIHRAACNLWQHTSVCRLKTLMESSPWSQARDLTIAFRIYEIQLIRHRIQAARSLMTDSMSSLLFTDVCKRYVLWRLPIAAIARLREAHSSCASKSCCHVGSWYGRRSQTSPPLMRSKRRQNYLHSTPSEIISVSLSDRFVAKYWIFTPKSLKSFTLSTGCYLRLQRQASINPIY